MLGVVDGSELGERLDVAVGVNVGFALGAKLEVTDGCEDINSGVRTFSSQQYLLLCLFLT
jgi:hypothetical protein